MQQLKTLFRKTKRIDWVVIVLFIVWTYFNRASSLVWIMVAVILASNPLSVNLIKEKLKLPFSLVKMVALGFQIITIIVGTILLDSSIKRNYILQLSDTRLVVGNPVIASVIDPKTNMSIDMSSIELISNNQHILEVDGNKLIPKNEGKVDIEIKDSLFSHGKQELNVEFIDINGGSIYAPSIMFVGDVTAISFEPKPLINSLKGEKKIVSSDTGILLVQGDQALAYKEGSVHLFGMVGTQTIINHTIKVVKPAEALFISINNQTSVTIDINNDYTIDVKSEPNDIDMEAVILSMTGDVDEFVLDHNRIKAVGIGKVQVSAASGKTLSNLITIESKGTN